MFFFALCVCVCVPVFELEVEDPVWHHIYTYTQTQRKSLSSSHTHTILCTYFQFCCMPLSPVLPLQALLISSEQFELNRLRLYRYIYICFCLVYSFGCRWWAEPYKHLTMQHSTKMFLLFFPARMRVTNCSLTNDLKM